MTAADQKRGKGNADDAVGLKCFPRDGPGRPQLHDKPIAVHPYVSIRRNVDLNSSSGTIADPIFGVDKTRLLDKPYALLWGIAIDLGPRSKIVFVCFENHRSCQWIGSASPKPYRARQTCVGCHIGSERRHKQERVAIKPDNLASGLRQIETIRNEFAGYEIEFAQDNRVLTSTR